MVFRTGFRPLHYHVAQHECSYGATQHKLPKYMVEDDKQDGYNGNQYVSFQSGCHISAIYPKLPFLPSPRSHGLVLRLFWRTCGYIYII